MAIVPSVEGDFRLSRDGGCSEDIHIRRKVGMVIRVLPERSEVKKSQPELPLS